MIDWKYTCGSNFQSFTLLWVLNSDSSRLEGQLTIQISISILYYPHELENHQDTKLLNCKHFRRQLAIFYHNRNTCTSLIVANKHTEPASRFVTLILVKSLLYQFLNIICSLFIQFSSAGAITSKLGNRLGCMAKGGTKITKGSVKLIKNYQRGDKTH